jgi:Xaa-Pro aminopeptidase
MQQRHFNLAMNPARSQLIAKMRRRRKGLIIEDLRLPLSQMRMVKQAPELKVLQRAIDITNETLLEIFKPGWNKKYKTEYELDADITAGFRRRQSPGHGFTPIIANGKKTCTIHPIDNDAQLEPNALLLVDLGAEFQNYTADISRTWPVNGTLSPRQRDVFEAVVDVQQYAYSLLKPGQNYLKYEKKVEDYMGKKLVELGLIKVPTRKNIRQYFPHRTSHSLGLDPHDPADYSGDIVENMVITVEPGIYIPEEGIGVRIEDDVLITKTGHKVLSAKLPVML